jgi:hypothetical protein
MTAPRLVMMRRVLEAIEAAVDAAAQGGHGSVAVLHGRAHRLADALERLERRGRPLEVLAGGFDVAGARGDFVSSSGERVEDPEALLALLRERLDTGRTVVLALDDIDLALPPVRWHDGFLRRSLPELVREHRLVVLAGVSVLDVLGPLDATVVGVPSPAPDGDAARARLRAAFDRLGEETAAKGYDLAVRTLRVAALEGMVFTVAALARVQGEDEDLLTDWLDDYLAVDGGPLEDLGFVDGKERPLARYGFRDRALWIAMHPEHGAEAWSSAPLGRRVARRYGAALAELYGHAPEAVFRIWSLAGGARAEEYVRMADAFATEHDHLRLLEAETDGARDPRSAERVMESLRQVIDTIASDDLLRYARALVELADVGSAELYDLLGVVAAREQLFGDAARCEALALELVEDPFAEVQRCVGLSGALVDLAHWESGGEPRLGLEVPWLDAIVDDRAELIAAAARTLERAGVAIEQVASGDREHWRAHLQHAVAQLDAVRGDPEAALQGEERAIALLGEPPRDSCNLRVLALLALSDAREELGDAAGAREAARLGVQVSVRRSELAEAARGLAKVGRMELALGDARAATQVLAHSLVIALELDLRWAAPGLWTQLSRCLEGPAALTCLALAGGDSADVGPEALALAASVRGDSAELQFLEQVTGIGRDATEAFLGTLV